MVDVAIMGAEISGRVSAPAVGFCTSDGVGAIVLLLGFGSVGVGG
jgi:hypothetical protein